MLLEYILTFCINFHQFIVADNRPLPFIIKYRKNIDIFLTHIKISISFEDIVRYIHNLWSFLFTKIKTIGIQLKLSVPIKTLEISDWTSYFFS